MYANLPMSNESNDDTKANILNSLILKHAKRTIHLGIHHGKPGIKGLNPTMHAPSPHNSSPMNLFSDRPHFCTEPWINHHHDPSFVYRCHSHETAALAARQTQKRHCAMVSECSSHYLLSTFIMCLAGKAAIYIPRPHHKLIWTAFPLMLRCDGRLTFQKAKNGKRKSINRTIETRTLSGAGSIACLFLLVIAGFYEPFGLSDHHLKIEKKKKLFRQTARVRKMRIPLVGNEQVHVINLTRNDDGANTGTAAASKTSATTNTGTSGGGLQLPLSSLPQLGLLLNLVFPLEPLVRQHYHR
ncbi:hypothetical protein L5515_019565 [Caenorhabditis briggsae]|uniref:Uncharacterized protein n=1 Tax=Caenorhabditis briggsae TaxID=6238 RepID=A0AAE9JVK6_CAEBR|nr:hypothetical protein L5515_019565 [Caenorhabditis briggsae]